MSLSRKCSITMNSIVILYLDSTLSSMWRLTPQFSGGSLTYMPWHFISHRPLQLLVRR
jgi:hypothetical protein